MQTAATPSIAAPPTQLCHDTRAPLIPRLRQLMHHQWQCAMDRAAARAVRAIDHPGVAADYRMAVQDRR
jgi:hypothetical protein